MQTSVNRIYLDSSAIVKLVVRESETEELIKYLAKRPQRVSSALARVEVVRAVRPYGPAFVRAARDILRGIYQMKVSDPLLDEASDLGPAILRTLDAIHLATALRFQPDVEVVTYDHRLRGAAHGIGLPAVSPGC